MLRPGKMPPLEFIRAACIQYENYQLEVPDLQIIQFTSCITDFKGWVFLAG